VHCDLWISTVIGLSGSKYYLAILDDFSHYLWTFPLRLQFDTFTTLSNFLHISLLSSVAQFRVASVTTGRNSTMYPDGPFYSPTSSCCACHAHTLSYKMVKLSALSAPSILLFAHYFSKLPWQHTNGWRAFTLLHTYSTIYPPRRSMPHVPMLPCSARHHPTSTFMCSVVPGTPIYPP
jgi:hypothetical protein